MYRTHNIRRGFRGRQVMKRGTYHVQQDKGQTKDRQLVVELAADAFNGAKVFVAVMLR